MKEFTSLGQFALHLLSLQAATSISLHRGLEKVAAAVEKTAKAEIGTYQQAIGPFPSWDPLAEVTKKQRLDLGYTEDDPGLRDGSMRDSIERKVERLEAVIASDDQNLVWFELGTSKQPPRPVLGPAVEHNHDVIRKELGLALVRGLLGGGPIPPSFEYDHEV